MTTAPPIGGPTPGQPLSLKGPEVSQLKAHVGQVLQSLNTPNLLDSPDALGALASQVKDLCQSFANIKHSNLGTDLKEQCSQVLNTIDNVTIVTGSKEFKADSNYKQSHLYEVLPDKANVTKVTNALGALGTVLGAID